jgi:hypothetical protein
MSITEVTAFITKLAFFPCELCEREHNASCTHEDCFNIHKQWLLQEVSEEITDKEKSTKAKWEINCDGYYPECTNCGEEPKDRKMSKICPNCGAEMENGEDER